MHARKAIVALAFSFALGCVSELPPSTLEVRDVQPREVDVGDRIEVVGNGFPLRRTARVVFRGHLHRPGLPPEAVAIATEVESRSEGRLELPLADDLAARMTGSGESAIHSTFRGEVLVTFPPLEAGTAPLLGRAKDVVLDVRPSGVRNAAVARREAIGRKLLDFLGLELASGAPASGGLSIAAVRAGSPAAHAGIEPGDVLVDFDGVRVGAVSDLVPDGEATAAIAVRRPGEPRPRNLTIRLAGFSQSVPRGLLASALLVSGVVLLFGLSLVRPTARLAWIERTAVQRVRASAHPRTWLSAVLRIAAGEAEIAPSLGAIALTSACVLAAVAPAAVIGAVDVAIVAAASIASCFAAAVLRGDGRSALRAAGELSRHVAPGAIAVVCAIATVGSLRLVDIVAAQGGTPWEWLAFRSPVHLAAVALWIAGAAALDVRRPTRDLDDLDRAPKPTPLARSVALGTAFLVATLYLGGARVPFLSAIEQQAWSGWQAIGAAILAAKAWTIFAAVALVRRLLGARAARVNGPLAASIVVLVAAAALSAWPLPSGAARLVSLATFVTFSAAFAWIAMRFASAWSRIGTEHVDPHV